MIENVGWLLISLCKIFNLLTFFGVFILDNRRIMNYAQNSDSFWGDQNCDSNTLVSLDD